MQALLDRLEGWASLTMDDRATLTRDIRRFVLAGMETGNPSPVRTLLTEFAEFNAQACYGLRAEVVKIYGQDI